MAYEELENKIREINYLIDDGYNTAELCAEFNRLCELMEKMDS